MPQEDEEQPATQLTGYPRPSVAVDVALLTVLPADEDGRFRLGVVVHRRGPGFAEGEWALPGTFLRERERLAEAVLRVLREKAGIRGEQPEQLAVFDDPARDTRGWVLSVAHVDVVPWARVEPVLGDDVRACVVEPSDPVRVHLPDGQRRLPFDHDAVVARAVQWARERYETSPDPAQVLEEPFTLRRLRLLHEAVTGEPVQKDTFRRRVEWALEPTGLRSTNTIGKPAMLYRRRRG